VNWNAVSDIAGTICLVLGAPLIVVAAIGTLLFPDVLTPMHSATKPQVLGSLVVLGIGLRLGGLRSLGLLALVASFQLIATPESESHGRSRLTSGRTSASRSTRRGRTQ
jgi:multicomponent Na+:H+ antiporter subunit G